MFDESVETVDHEVAEALKKEVARQENNIELIASENFASRAVLETAGSVMTNKYAEGYPGKRYYGGCENMDTVERLAIDRACELFNCKYANVQAHSGSGANMAAYMALINPGDKILSMDLSHGGHLSHGAPVSFSGQLYEVAHYGVNEKSERIEAEEVIEAAEKFNPDLIVAGYSAYPREIPFDLFREVADAHDAFLVVDIAHIAGLVAAGHHSSPFPQADVVTSTTHKTLRGPRGGLILTNDQDIADKINKKIFPGIQGGPLMHQVAAKAVAFKEAMTEEFADYQKQVISNAIRLGEVLDDRGFHIVSGGTDNHLLLVNLVPKNITGKLAEKILDEVGITANKNTVPGETESPFVTSGVRLGTPAVTTRGMKEAEMEKIGELIDRVVSNPEDTKAHKMVKVEVSKLTAEFPLYPFIEGSGYSAVGIQA